MAKRAANTGRGGEINESWGYDKLGRPVLQGLSAGGRERKRRRYEWGTGDKLESIIDSIDSLSRKFEYDSFGAPEAEVTNTTLDKRQRETRARHLDKAGNVYEKKDESDREYASGGRIITANGRRYKYNDCGDMIEKEDADGRLMAVRVPPKRAS